MTLFSARLLDGEFNGDVLAPGHPLYDRARMIFNGYIDRRPAVILRPRSLEDVGTGLRFAVEHGLPLALRGGGHNVAGLALVDDGVVIDFHHFKRIGIDSEQRLARVQPGVIWGEFDAESRKHSLATTGGIISDTGVAGLTLGGGVGWLMGKHGLACDNLVSARVMLADGTLMRASAAENPDLFWALRGGGGNFGIVVEFEFQLHPVDWVYAGSIVYRAAHARQAVRRFRTVAEAAPDELTMSLVAATDSDGRKVVSIDCCYLGDREGGDEVTRPLLPDHTAIVTDSRSMRPYVDWQQQFNDPYRRGRRSYWKSIYLSDLSDEFADVFRAAIENAPSPHTMLTFDHVHGQASRVPVADTAFGNRDQNYLFLVNTNWDHPADDEKNIEWTRALFADVSRFGKDSAYVNYLSEEGRERIISSYGADTHHRLRTVKTRYDPRNIFRANQNIEPYR